MKMKRKIASTLIGLGLVVLAGCTHQTQVSKVESYDEMYDPLFTSNIDLNSIWQKLEERRLILSDNFTIENQEHYMYLFNRYIALIHERNFATQNYLNTTRHLQVSWGNEGRAGAAILEPGFVHVLGGTPYLPNRPVARTAAKTPPVPTALSPYDLAWSRYCNTGLGMTAQDWRIVHEANYVVPKEYRKNCYPPK